MDRKFKAGDVVRCVSHIYDFITYGEEYKVLFDQEGSHYVMVNDNYGDKKYYKISDFELVMPVTEAKEEHGQNSAVVSDGAIVSDGGSSSYYQLTIVNKAGESLQCELGDIARHVFGNDADLFNIVKACRRAYEKSQGRGKDGASISYDMNKVKYFADEFAHWNKDKK